mgnify:CR=1 FL=1
MVYLTGDTRSHKIIVWLHQNGYGRMWIDIKPTPYHGEPWGLDNGAYRDFLSGHELCEEKYLRRLERAATVKSVPYMAVVPDIVGKGKRSLEFSMKWVEKVKSFCPSSWPWYLVVQDEMTLEDVQGIIRNFQGIFLGGTNFFKSTAWYWSELAHRNGVRFHYGRAGTTRKIFHALSVNADSADSAFPLWNQSRLLEVNIALQGQKQIEFFGPEVMARPPSSFTTAGERLSDS